MAKKLSDEVLKLNIQINGNKAKKELYDLEQRQRKLNQVQKDLRQEKERLKRANKQNTAEWKKVTQAIRENANEIKSTKERMTILRKEIGVTGLTVRQLKSEQTRLNLVLSNMIPGSAEYKRYQKELDQVNIRLRKLRRNGKRADHSLGRLANGFNKYSTMAFGLIGAITGLVFSLQTLAKGSAELSDAQADVSKTTGLSTEQVASLSRELAKLDTRTPRLELLQLAEEAGRLGKKGSRDIISFVDAANKMKVALGDDLPGDVNANIRVVGKMAEQYEVGAASGYDLGQSMNRLGSAINAVSASGSNQAGFQLDILRRMSGIAASADITADKVIGLAAAADEAGQSQEITATALNKAIVDMMQNTEKYAEIAGVSVNDFTRQLDSDAYEALLQFLSGLQGNNEGMRIMAQRFEELGIDGDRSIQVLAALANNVDNIRAKQTLANKAMREATSLTDEYNQKNNNLAANMEKVGRRIREAFIGGKFYEGIEKRWQWLERITRRKPSEGLQKDLITMNAMFDLIRDSNVDQARRNKLIADLNDKYADYLPKLIKEKDALEEISRIQFSANQALQEKIKIMASRELDEEYQRRILEIQKEIYQLELKVAEREQRLKGLSKRDVEHGFLELELHNLAGLRESLNETIAEYERFKAKAQEILTLGQKSKVYEDWELSIKEAFNQYTRFIEGSSAEALFTEFSKSDLIARMDGFQVFLSQKLSGVGMTLEQAHEKLGKLKSSGVPTIDSLAESSKTEDPRIAAEKKIRDFMKSQYTNEANDLLAHYDEIIELSKKHFGQAHELEAMRFAAKKEMNQQAQAEEAERLAAEMDAIIEEGRKKEELRRRYGLVSKPDEIQEQYDNELELLEGFHEKGLLKEEEFLAAKDYLAQYYADKERDRQERNFEEIRKARQRQVSDMARYADAARGTVEALISHELNGVEEVVRRRGEGEDQYTQRREQAERERREIAKKYAILEGLTSVSQIGINTWEAISRLPADLPFPVAVLLKGLVFAQGLAQASAAMSQVNKIRSYAGGYYPVLDQHGDRYNAVRNESLATGEYRRPTVSFSRNMLVGEKQPEIVIDGLTTQKLKQFRPDVLDAIYATARQVKGYSEGNYPEYRSMNIDLQETNLLLREILRNGQRPNIAVLPEDTRRRMRNREELERIIKEQSKINA